MHLFYSPHINEDLVELDQEESRHLAKVLRLNIGDQVALIDGNGNRYLCSIAIAHPKRSTLQILEKDITQETFGITIAAAPTKNMSRWEWFLEKATEIGIDAIHPIISSHSERKVLKQERQERILISAMKQSFKATLPQLNEISSFDTYINRPFEGRKYIAHCHEKLPKRSLKEIHRKGEKALILIGPEGDFNVDEVKKAVEKGFEPIHLGKSRLRTETAALIACHTIHLINA